MGSDLFLFELLSGHEPVRRGNAVILDRGLVHERVQGALRNERVTAWVRFMGSDLFLFELLRGHEPVGRGNAVILDRVLVHERVQGALRNERVTAWVRFMGSLQSQNGGALGP